MDRKKLVPVRIYVFIPEVTHNTFMVLVNGVRMCDRQYRREIHIPGVWE